MISVERVPLNALVRTNDCCCTLNICFSKDRQRDREPGVFVAIDCNKRCLNNLKEKSQNKRRDGTCVAGQVLWSVGGKSIGDHFIFGTHKCAHKVASQFSPWKRQKAMSQTIICYFLSDSPAYICTLLINISMKMI